MHKKNNDVSVIITTKNRKYFLLRALDSLIHQSSIPKEVIIIDDCSAESDILLPDELVNLKNSLNISYYKNKVSMGGNYSRNLGVKYSTSNILMFLDDDDFWLPNKIKIQSDIFDNDLNCEVGLVYTGKQFVNSSNLLSVTRVSKETTSHKSIWNGNFPGSTSSVALRKDVFFKSKGFDENLNSLQDYDLWIRVIKISKAVWDLEFNLLYTIHDNQKSQVSSDVFKHMASIDYLKKKYNTDLNNLGILSKRKFMSRMEHVIARAYRKNNDFNFIKFYLKSLLLYPSIRTLILPFYYK